MRKIDIINSIAEQTGIPRVDVMVTLEAFFSEVKNSLHSGSNVYIRGFGSFIVKKRAKKIGRNISKNIPVEIPAHYIPAFKPAKIFTDGVRSSKHLKAQLAEEKEA